MIKRISKYLLESGLNDSDYNNPIKVFQYIMLNAYMLFYIFAIYQFQSFGYVYANEIFNYVAIFEIGIAFILGTLYLTLRFTKKQIVYNISKYASVSSLMILVIILAWSGGSTKDTAVFWSIVFIPFSSFILTRNSAIILNSIVWITNSLIISYPSLFYSPVQISDANIKRFIYIYFTVFIVIYFMRKALSYYIIFQLHTIEKLEKNMNIDFLTEISNRKDITNKIYYEYNRFMRTKRCFSIILCDIDFFKSINDTHGHNIGDMVLKEVARILKSKIRKHEHVARWGGEEFMILLPECDLKDAFVVSEKIRKSIENNIFANKIKLTMSFGVESICSFEKVNDISELIEEADKKLYRAKKTGRNKTVGV